MTLSNTGCQNMLSYTCFNCMVTGRLGQHADRLLALLAQKTDEHEVAVSSRKLMMLCTTGCL